jgi:hypothetical protein
MLTTRADVDDGSVLRPLAGTPWSTRMAAGSAGRAALEIYRGASLIDVMVANSFAPLVLRGARRVSRHGLMFCVAWGCLPPDDAVRVEFRARRLRVADHRARLVLAVPATRVGDHFWIATAAGRFERVTATSLDCHAQCDVRTLRVAE